jgi:hypothetical protein
VKQGEQRHYESRRAEAALRAVKVDQGLLDRMQAAVTRKILDGDEIRAIGLASQHDAGVDRVIDEPPTLPSLACGGGKAGGAAAQHHRARPAIPLSATFLGSGRAFMKAKIIQKREVWCDAAQMDHRAATQEMDMATHARLISSGMIVSHPMIGEFPHRRKCGKMARLAFWSTNSADPLQCHAPRKRSIQ